MNSDCRFYVFREGRRSVSAEVLLAGLRGSLRAAADENGWVDALLRAGELECGLEDAGSLDAEKIAGVTDACAKKLVSWSFRSQPELMLGLPLRLEGEVTVSTPEGFAYYALHPRQYAEVVNRLGSVHEAVVIGIRSIGTSLSAMAAAALRRKGARVERFTVRPTGHPFDRRVEWTAAEKKRIASGCERNALFLIVDEGPGLSGSSFLSVAEWLNAEGVRRDRIVMVPSHKVNVAALRANNAMERWKRFSSVDVPQGRYPAGEWIGSGEWRARFCQGEWPGAWTTLEPPKFVGAGAFMKFEGLGSYGARARAQARALEKAGFGARVIADEYGYLGYEFLRGRQAKATDLTRERLQTLADYCAFRAEAFGCAVTEQQRNELATMARVNYEREFGAKATMPRLDAVRTTVCDGRMGPAEWVLTEDGRFVKVDATSHGDGHFFPGPCDIAWDLAGAMVEWEMDASARDALLGAYTAVTKDRVAARIEAYLLAYAVFRCAWCRMAAAGMKGTAEEARLTREALRYRGVIERMGFGTEVPMARAS